MDLKEFYDRYEFEIQKLDETIFTEQFTAYFWTEIYEATKDPLIRQKWERLWSEKNLSTIKEIGGKQAKALFIVLKLVKFRTIDIKTGKYLSKKIVKPCIYRIKL